MKSVFQAIPFTNHFGQVIEPGEKVVCVSQGYNHSIGVRIATYLGANIRADGKVASVQVQAETSVGGYWRQDGTRATYQQAQLDDTISNYERRTVPRKVSLPRKRIYPTR